MLKLFNTAHRKLEIFRPIRQKTVHLYTCGPTVYAPAHLGNFRSYIFADVLKRTLQYNDYRVKHIMNITDVGHLTGDSDTGEDKLARAAKEERKTAWEVAEEYTKLFQEDFVQLNLLPPARWVKATDHIKQQIELVQRLEKKGLTYRTDDGIYFDTSKFSAYGKFAHLDLKGLRAGERVGMGGKRHKTDFALWKFSPVGVKRDMQWLSPWGVGFPGWHIECSAMAREYLGQPFDIHTGGIDHIPIHHPNEIAQSEAAYGKPLARYWLHNDFLVFPGKNSATRMGKSERNIITLADMIARGIEPLAYRYLCLTVHYRKKLEFSWNALEAAAAGLRNLRALAEGPKAKTLSSALQKQFLSAINNDLNTPKALATVWKSAKTGISQTQIKQFDRVLGLNLVATKAATTIPALVKNLAAQREAARVAKQWSLADKLRQQIEQAGFKVEDTPTGPKIRKI